MEKRTKTIQYQTKIALVEGIDLFSGLKVTLEKDRVSTEYDGMTAYSQWATLNATGEAERTAVTIELPTTAGNEYQELSCKLAFSVSAVQGNTYTEQPEENTVYIYNATDLLLFAKSVNCEINENYTKLWNDKGTNSVVTVDGVEVS